MMKFSYRGQEIPVSLEHETLGKFPSLLKFLQFVDIKNKGFDDKPNLEYYTDDSIYASITGNYSLPENDKHRIEDFSQVKILQGNEEVTVYLLKESVNLWGTSWGIFDDPEIALHELFEDENRLYGGLESELDIENYSVEKVETRQSFENFIMLYFNYEHDYDPVDYKDTILPDEAAQ